MSCVRSRPSGRWCPLALFVTTFCASLACSGPERVPLLSWGLKGGPAPVVQYPDHDRDGIENARDRCLDLPEDLDGHRDEDGCPDTDHNGDGIPDAKEDELSSS